MKSTRLVLVVAAIAIIAFVAYRRAGPARKAKSGESNGDLVLQVRAIPVIHNLALGSFTIPAKGTHDVKIALEETGLRNARLSGEFSVAGGAAIQVMLLDQTQYSRLKSGSTPSEVLYLSKMAASGDIQAAFPRMGTYYLVFDNSSSSSDTTVNSDVSLRYETVQIDSGTSKAR
jgi:hypothetical protein